MKIYIGSDHGGFELKKELIEYLNQKQIEVIDCGTHDENRTDYPIYAKKVSQEVIDSGYNAKGILICKSGHGMVTVANKFKGIRASIAYKESSLENGIKDDDLNVMVISANDTNYNQAIKYIDIFLNTEFKNVDNYLKRIKQLEQIETENGLR